MPVSVHDGPSGVVSRATTTLNAWIESVIERLTVGRAWRAKTLLFSVALSYFLAFPSIDVIRSSEFDRTWNALQRQIDAPLVPHDYEPQSHEAKTALRLTVPVLAHILGIGHRGALVLQIVSGVVVLWLAMDLAFVVSGDRAIAALTAIGIATTFPGVAAFADDYRGLFDGIAYALLLGAMRVRFAPLVTACVFLAAFTDERALLASALIVGWWWLRDGAWYRDEVVRERPASSWLAMLAVGVAWIAYALTRRWLVRGAGLSTPVGGPAHVGMETFVRQLAGFPFGAWSALETLWVPVVAAIAALVVLERWLIAATFTALVAVILVAANSVTDVTRSAGYVFPAFFVALAVLQTTEGTARVRRLLTVCSALAVIVPTYYTGMNEIRWFLPAPLQAVRMLFHGGAGA